MYLVNGSQHSTYEAALSAASALMSEYRKRGYKPLKAKALPEDNGGAHIVPLINHRGRMDAVIIEDETHSARPAADCPFMSSEPVAPESSLTLLEFAATVHSYALSIGDEVLEALVRDMVPAAIPGQTERLSDYYEPRKRAQTLVDTVALDGLDVTGLESGEAEKLREKLRRWNGGNGLFVWRYPSGGKARPGAPGARRYIAGGVRIVDLEDELVKGLSCYDDLVRAAKSDPDASWQYV